MPTQLPVRQERQSSMDAVLRAMVDQAVAEIVAEVIPTFTGAIAEIVGRVNAAIPQVNVAAPQVSSPVTVNIPEQEPPDVNVTVGGLELLTAKLDQTNNLLGRLIYLAEQPTVKDVHRDANDRIDKVTEHRG